MIVSICNRLSKISGLEKMIKAIYQFSNVSYSKSISLITEEPGKRIESVYKKPEGKVFWERKAPNFGFDLSIIIPFYKTEKYARRCIESVLSQKSAYSVEVILVDDGSPDSCGEIIDSYSYYANVVTIHQENAGLSAARNVGLQAARGAYVMFLDSDDILLMSSIQHLMNDAIKYDADIVEGGFYTFSTRGKKKEYPHTFQISNKGTGMYGYAWGKVMKASLFDNVCFPTECWYEDTIIPAIIYQKAKATVCIDKLVVGYFINQSGITAQTKSSIKCIDTLYIVEYILEYYCRNNIIVPKSLMRGLLHQLGPYLFFRTRKLDTDLQYDVFLVASVMAEKYGLLALNTNGFYEMELLSAMKNKQFKRWKWASILM